MFDCTKLELNERVDCRVCTVYECGFHSVVAFFSTCYSPAMDCAIQEKNAIFSRRWKQSTFKESYILVCFLSLRAFGFHFSPFFCRSSFSVLQFGWTTYASLQSASTANYINSTRIECEHQLVVCRRWFVSPWNSGAKTHIEKKKNDKANKSSLLIAARPAPGDEYSSCTWFSLYFKVGF